MEESPDYLDAELQDLKKQLAAQEERLRGKSQLLSQIQNTTNDDSSVSDNTSVGGVAVRNKPEPRRMSSTQRRQKKKGFKMYSPMRKMSSRTMETSDMISPSPSTKRTFRDDLASSNEFVAPSRTLSFMTISEALENNEPEEVYVVKRKQKNVPRILLSKDEQFRSQIKLLNQKYRTLGPFVMNLLSQVFRPHHVDEEESVGSVNAQSDMKPGPLVDLSLVEKDGVMEKIFLCSEMAEIAEKTRWLDEVTRLLFHEKICPLNIQISELYFLDQISEKIYETISTKCTFNMSLFKTISPRVVILGPRESGKTTLLHLFTRSVMDIYLNETNEYISTFLWVVNWKNLSFPSLDTVTFYTLYMSKLLDQLGIQKPTISPYIKNLKKLMTDFSKLSKVDPAFMTQFKTEYLMLRIFRDRANKLIKQENFDGLMLLTTSLPYHLSQVFGFRSVLNVFDNFDFSHVKLLNSSEDSSKDTNFVCVYLKHHLAEQNYLISGRKIGMFTKSLKIVKSTSSPRKKKKSKYASRRSLNNSLNASFEMNRKKKSKKLLVDSNDLIMSSVLLHTEGIIDPDDVQDLPKAITLVNTNLYTDYKQTQMISIEHFRGCPAYLAHVIRFVTANPSTSKIMKSTPVPEREVRSILENLIESKKEVGDVQDGRYQLMKSLK